MSSGTDHSYLVWESRMWGYGPGSSVVAALAAQIVEVRETRNYMLHGVRTQGVQALHGRQEKLQHHRLEEFHDGQE